MQTTRIEEYLDSLFPNPRCELIYHSDYELLLAIVLSAQTTDKRVNSVTPILFQTYPKLEDLKSAPIDALESILRPIGSFRKKAIYIKEISSILVDEYQGCVPRDRDLLMTLPGVGRKTANVFLSEFYQDSFIGVDTHVERVSKRLKIANAKDSVLQVEQKLMKKFPKESWAKLHLQMVLFGRYYCKAVHPSCEECGLRDICREKNKNIRT
ncbi:MAG: endonuclease III [Bacilli bacterium]|nr:endonuclease III [Bacilli bacterium]